MMRESELNLIPSDIIENTLIRERMKFWLFLLMGCLSVLLLLHIVIKIVNRSIDQSLRGLMFSSEEYDKEMTGFRLLEKRENELMIIKNKINDISQRTPTIKLINAIDSAMNDNIILTHWDVKYDYLNFSNTKDIEGNAVKGYFSSSPQVKTASSQTQGVNRLIIQGRAVSNADIASMLTGLTLQPVIDNARLKYSKAGESDQGKGIIFEIECSLSDWMNLHEPRAHKGG